jgi:hypothetical protein
MHRRRRYPSHQTCKAQYRKTRNMKKQGNMTSSKVHNSSVTKYNVIEVDERLEKEYKRSI